MTSKAKKVKPVAERVEDDPSEFAEDDPLRWNLSEEAYKALYPPYSELLKEE